MSANHYRNTYEHAAAEIAEIDAQIQRLIRRKELLENLLEPLKLLVPEPGPLEAPASGPQPEVEEMSVDARSNGRSIHYEDIAELAYRFWNERGQTHGYHEEDWFRAAHELHNSATL